MKSKITMNEKIESEWFYKNIINQKEIYVPIEIVRKLELDSNSLIAVKIKSKESILEYPARYRYRVKNDGNCGRFNIPKDMMGSVKGNVAIQIKKLDSPSIIELNPNEIDLSTFPSSKVSSWIDDDSIVLWDDDKSPLIVKRKINSMEIAKYLGLYYAEGGKSSHYSIIGSTKDIAGIILSAYNKIILNPRYSAVICYRKLENENERIIERRIREHWSDIDKDIKLYINGKKSTNIWSDEFGQYRIDDSRMLSLKIHLWLIETVLKLGLKNKVLLEEFLIGGALGDGGVSNRRKNSFQHFFISSNKQEYLVWEKICKRLNIPYRLRILSNRNSVYIIICNYFAVFDLFNKGLFKEYKKRRKKLIVGLKNRVETKKIHQIQMCLNPKEQGFTEIVLKPLEVD